MATVISGDQESDKSGRNPLFDDQENIQNSMKYTREGGSIENGSLCIKNVPSSLDEKELSQLFSLYGNVLAVELGCLHQDGLKWGKVVFKSQKEGEDAMKALQGEPPLFLHISWFNNTFINELQKSDTDSEKIAKEKRKVDVNQNMLEMDGLSSNNIMQVDIDIVAPYPFVGPNYKPQQCYNCRKQGRLVCSVCMVWYCSVKCQNYSWPDHMKECRPPPPLIYPDGSYLNLPENRTGSILSVQHISTPVKMNDRSEPRRVVSPVQQRTCDHSKGKSDRHIEPKKTDIIKPKEFCAAKGIFPEEIPQPKLNQNCVYKIRIPVEGFVSPSEFNVVLECSEVCFSRIYEELSESEQSDTNWKVSRQQLVAAYSYGEWHRGVAMKKMLQEFTIYLLDQGVFYPCQKSQLRPLSSALLKYPACAVQVCMEGVAPTGAEWTEDSCNYARSFINNTEEGVEVVIKGRESSGRLAVDCLKKGKISLKDMLVRNSHAVPTKMIPFEGSMRLESYPTEQIIERREGMCIVTHVDDIGQFYILPREKLDHFTCLMEDIQDGNQPLDRVSVGLRCLALRDGVWFRTEILDVSSDGHKAKVIYIDHGMKELLELQSLKKLPCRFEENGMVHQVGLFGVEAKNESGFSKEAVQAFKEILDVENEKEFVYKFVKPGKVTLNDFNDKSVGDMMIQKGHAIAVGEEVEIMNEGNNHAPKYAAVPPKVQVGCATSVTEEARITDKVIADAAMSNIVPLVPPKGYVIPVPEEEKTAVLPEKKLHNVKGQNIDKASVDNVQQRKTDQANGHPKKSKKDHRTIETNSVPIPNLTNINAEKKKILEISNIVCNGESKPSPAATSVSVHKGDNEKKEKEEKEEKAKAEVSKTAVEVKEVKANPFEAALLALSTMKFDNVSCLVTVVTNLKEFYITRAEDMDTFEHIMMDIQDPQQLLDSLSVEDKCACLIDDVWYRARIEKISPDKTQAKLFCLDTGRRETKRATTLRKLEKFTEVPGLARKAALFGVKPKQGDIWSKETIETFKELVDVGGETEFNVTVVDEEMMSIKLTDATGLDVASALIEMELISEDDSSTTVVEQKSFQSDKLNKESPADEVLQTAAVSATTTEKTDKMDESLGKAILVQERPSLIAKREDKISKGSELEKKSVTFNENSNETFEIETGNQEEFGRNVERLISRPELMITSDSVFKSVVSSVVDLNEFYISLVEDTEQFGNILADIQDPTESLRSFDVGVTCACRVDDIWFRCKVEKVMPDKIEVFLIDTGKRVAQPRTHLKALVKHRDAPGLAIKAGLHGVKPKEGETWSQDSRDSFLELTDVATGETEFQTKMIEKDKDGKLMVQLLDWSGLDVAEAMVELDLAVKIPVDSLPLQEQEKASKDGDADPKNFERKIEEKREDVKGSEPKLSGADNSTDSCKPKMKENLGKQIDQSQYRKCSITTVVDLEEFYITPTSRTEQFEELMIGIQDFETVLDSVRVGDVCVCPIDDIWYRATIEKVLPDQTHVELFCIDTGRRETKPATTLRKLETFTDVPGLVRKAGLFGVKPKQGVVWSNESVETFKELIDVGEETEFNVKIIQEDEEDMYVKLSDNSGLDIASALKTLDLVSWKI